MAENAGEAMVASLPQVSVLEKNASVDTEPVLDLQENPLRPLSSSSPDRAEGDHVPTVAQSTCDEIHHPATETATVDHQNTDGETPSATTQSLSDASTIGPWMEPLLHESQLESTPFQQKNPQTTPDGAYQSRDATDGTRNQAYDEKDATIEFPGYSHAADSSNGNAFQHVIPSQSHPNTTHPNGEPDPDLSGNHEDVADLAPVSGPVLADFATQLAPPMIPDTDMTDEAYAESTTTSYVTSIASEVSKGVIENERLYPSYGQHDYGMPIDEDEMDRMDLQHRKYELVLGGKHFLAPIGPSPHRILDLGTGTGIWALDVADMFPTAQVIGVDVAPIQPKWVAANCHFEIDDVEASWIYKPDSFDFIHFRDPLYSIRDWPKLMRQSYEHLKPGGWCELACIYPVVMCDDGTMPPDSGFKLICEKFMEASAIMGTPTSSPTSFARYLRDAGFVNVSENIFKVPSSPWPKDKRLKKIGILEMTNIVEGATAFGLRVFSQAFGWSREQTEIAMVAFRRDVKNRNYHQYCQYFVVYGQKPLDNSSMHV